jgi:predicted nucleic acid-binding protein
MANPGGRVSKFLSKTALEFGYAVATSNLRHFRLIPNLTVKQFPEG